MGVKDVTTRESAWVRTPAAAFVALLLFLQAAVFLIFRDRSYLQVHDNLDLFMAHYEMIGRQHAWFAHDVTLPVLHGVNRDLFGSEFLLYNVLYILFPTVAAYLVGYFLKIAIGMASFLLLVMDFLKERDRFVRLLPVLLPVAAAYGMIPVFPTYGIAFTSVPLVIWLLRRIWFKQGFRMWPASAAGPGARLLVYAALFCYPVLSYFSYHGFFILAYMAVAVNVLWIREKRFPGRMLAALAVLSAGYIVFEYRLFGAMLLDHTVTIRTTMEHGELTFLQALKAALDEFLVASFHNQDSHTYLVLPVVLIGAILIAVSDKKPRTIFSEPVVLLLVWIVLNCLNFGFYQFAPYRHLLEMLMPPLKGFEFARTAYFNTFLWYAAFAVVLVRLAEGRKAPDAAAAQAPDPSRGTVDARRKVMRGRAASLIACAAAVVVMFVPQVYNDFYYTVYNHAYILLKHRETSRVNVREYYSAALFERILREMDYCGEWSAAYGMHPAILNYNGIASLDGYLGMYAQSYKDQWTRVEAPAFAGSPWIREYFTGWGARVCLYSGSDENTYEAYRYPQIQDRRLMVDLAELQALDCRYIFSRIEFDNAAELGLRTVGCWSGTDETDGTMDDDSPYVITVYEVPRQGGVSW